MSSANPSRVGQNQATGAVDALWQTVLMGEVLTAYETAKVLKPLVQVRQITHGKSATFDATFNAVGRYHTPGTEILGQKIRHTQLVVTLDELLIADVFVALIDELKNHYDVRAPYTQALGRALALIEDRTIAQCLVKAARGAELFPGDGGGVTIKESDIAQTGVDFDTSADDLITAINLAKQSLDEADVPVDTMQVNALFKPAQYYLIANSDKNINRDYGGDGSLKSNKLRLVSDVNIYKSNAPLFGQDVTPYDEITNSDGVVGNPAGTLPEDFPVKYHADLTKTRGVVWVQPAVAYLQLLGLTMETAWDPRRQGTLMLAKMAVGMGPLRNKCAREIAKD